MSHSQSTLYSQSCSYKINTEWDEIENIVFLFLSLVFCNFTCAEYRFYDCEDGNKDMLESQKVCLLCVSSLSELDFVYTTHFLQVNNTFSNS